MNECSQNNNTYTNRVLSSTESHYELRYIINVIQNCLKKEENKREKKKIILEKTQEKIQNIKRNQRQFIYYRFKRNHIYSSKCMHLNRTRVDLLKNRPLTQKHRETRHSYIQQYGAVFT